MTRFALIIALLWLLPNHAMGQAVVIRSGEHDGFTRLVVPIGAERSWVHEQQDRRHKLTFAPPIQNYDLSDVFTRIPRNRLVNIGQSDGLELSLACDCEVRLFRFRDRFLVIDIADSDTMNTRSNLRTVRPTFRPTIDVQRPVPRRTAEPVGLPNPFDRPQLSLSTEELPPPAATTPPEIDGAALNNAADHLAEQMARALATGLLEAAPGQPLSAGDPLQSTAVEQAASDRANASNLEEAFMPPAISTTDPGPATPGIALRAETAFDTIRQGLGAAISAQPPLSCDPETELAISTWSNGLGFEQEIGWLRAQIYDDRDQLIPDAVIDLARFYIYYGFGAEAMFWLHQLPSAPETELAIARYLNDEPGSAFSPIETMAACNGMELLWRYLDDPNTTQLSTETLGPVFQAFTRLPAELRDILGPELARRLQEDGEIDTAQDVRNVVARGGRLTESRQLLLDMDLGQHAAPDNAITSLEDAMHRESSSIPDAMLHYLRVHRDENSVVPIEQLIAADALLREASDLPEQGGLWHEMVFANARADRLGRALDLLDQTNDSTLKQSVLTDLFASFLGRNDDASLMILAAARADRWHRLANTMQLRREISGRFLSDGLPELAFRIAPRGQPIEAWMVDAPDNSDPEQGEVLSLWQRGDWQSLAQTSTGPHTVFAEQIVAIENSPSTSADPNDLRAIQETVADSAAIRALVEVTLTTPPTLSSAD